MVFVQSQVWIELGGERGFISTDSLNSWLSRVFVFLSFSDETHSDRNYNDQSKTKTENRENNYTEWIFGIHSIWCSADSNCWVVRSPCEHYTGAGIITGSNSITPGRSYDMESDHWCVVQALCWKYTRAQYTLHCS